MWGIGNISLKKNLFDFWIDFCRNVMTTLAIIV